ncbi:MAG: hypothetical protein Q9225_007379 [Loekoesia sp. 1 TL-2023]
MIERATTCLETGGKHILRIPNTPFRTHRHLHSAFWSHGAGDINLPAWWHAFLQVPPSHSQWLSKGDTRRIASDNVGLGFLDFLYPVQTLAFIRKYVNENSTLLRRHRRSQLPSHRHRAYTSAADRPVDTLVRHRETTHSLNTGDVSKDENTAVETAHSTEARLKAELHDLLFAKDYPADTRQLWQLYERMQQLSISVDPADLAQLFRCLRTSSRTFDIEKTRELFNAVALPDRRATHYKCAISAALSQDDLGSAMAMQEEAVFRAQGSFGLPILKYAVQHSKWKVAVAIWQQCKDYKQSDTGRPSIWKDVKTLPLSDLLVKAKEAVEAAPSSDDATSTQNFAIALAQSALSIRSRQFDQSLQTELVEIAQSMQQPNLGFFKAAILQSFSMGVQSREHNQGGLDLYKSVRAKPDLVPDLELLDAVLRRYHTIRSSQEMYEVLEDYRKYHTEPPRSAYRLLMSQLARHGDFATVDQLFQESIARFGDEDISILALQLLYACFRRAEIDRAISVIESLQQKYGYSPDLRAWNIVLATYARIGDCDSAMMLWKRLAAVNLRPDGSSYGILMGMFAKRSDYEATNALYEQAISEGIKPNLEMVGSLVLALATNDRLDEAEKTAAEAIEMDLEVSQRQTRSLPGDYTFTRMWNILLGQYAIKGQLDKVFDVQKSMHERGVAFDGMTYAALMQSLCVKKLPAAAEKILRTVMPKRGVHPTALHYAIVMSGFVSIKHYQPVSHLQKRMVKEGIKPTFSVQNALLRFAFEIDEREHTRNVSEHDTFQADRAESILAQILDSLDPMELAPLGPSKFAHTLPPNIALHSSYFPYLIALYGRKRSFDKVAEIYDKFISTARKFNVDVEASPPVEMLSALMVSYTNAGAHNEVQKCWDLALEKSHAIACKANADSSQPGWVLYKYRFILALPLTRYMRSLQATSRVDELSAIIASLQRDGYQLSVHNWNVYVQVLIQDKDPVLAYEICEKQLMDGWPGWERFGHPMHVKRKIKKQWTPKSWEMDRPFPLYETFVHLASAYLDAQGMAYGMGKEMLQEFERVAPRTLEAVYSMPRIDDTIQNQLLKRD